MVRNYASYVEHIKQMSSSYCAQFNSAYKSFPKIEEIVNVDEEVLFDELQIWINNSIKNPSTIKYYFEHIKQYLHYRGMKLHPLDIKQNLKFPTKMEEELHPLSIDEFLRILESSDFRHKILYLAQSSSGMRIGEIVQLRKKHIVTNMERIMVKIPAKFTKKKRARTTLFSKEVSKLLLSRLHKMDDNDLVFGTSENLKTAEQTEVIYISRLLNRIGLNQKYETNGRMKITTHSFRSFFITKTSRHDENLAKYFAGQKGYLLQYDRLTDEEKLEYYIEFEPDLLVYDQTKNEEKIRKLKEANTKLADQSEEIKSQDIRIKQLERMYAQQNNPIWKEKI